ncbi:MAG: sugar phosphate isomerase/epimerase family protein [Candidatus Latescibacterota bacterium]|jgi:sugar phosphate isomerase/epimerase
MQHCLFSISYAGLWGQDRLELADFVDRAAALGYGGVMIAGKRPHLSPLDAAPARLAELRARLDRAGISCPVIGAYTDFSGTAPPMIPAVELQIAYVESLARIAAAIGARYLRVFTGYERDNEPLIHTWQRVVASLQECSDRTAPYGVTLAVQNHHDLGVCTDAMEELIREVDRPNCRLGFDAWSLALRGEDLYAAARRMAPWTAVTTNADYIRLPRAKYRPQWENYEATGPDLVRAVPFGEGGIDYEAFFRGLREGGFDGIATYEMCAPLRGGGSMANLDRCARQYLEWMRARGW